MHLNRQALLEVAIGYYGDLEGNNKVHLVSMGSLKILYMHIMPPLRKANFGDEKQCWWETLKKTTEAMNILVTKYIVLSCLWHY